MDVSLDGLSLISIQQALYRNIVSIRESQDLFDDLSGDPGGWNAAISLDAATKPWTYASSWPIIDRPFEEAEFISAILFPFEPNHWSASRFSSGDFGVWYGSNELETTIYETVHHWRQGFLADAGWDHYSGVAVERRIHRVHCDTHLINLTTQADEWPELVGENYGFCQKLGRQVQDEGHPGLWATSARSPGTNAALFTPKPLSVPSTVCYVTYVLSDERVKVYRDRQAAPFLEID